MAEGTLLQIVPQLATSGSVKLRYRGLEYPPQCGVPTQSPAPSPREDGRWSESLRYRPYYCGSPKIVPPLQLWGWRSRTGYPVFCAPFSPTIGSQETILVRGGRQPHRARLLPEIWSLPDGHPSLISKHLGLLVEIVELSGLVSGGGGHESLEQNWVTPSSQRERTAPGQRDLNGHGGHLAQRLERPRENHLVLGLLLFLFCAGGLQAAALTRRHPAGGGRMERRAQLPSRSRSRRHREPLPSRRRRQPGVSGFRVKGRQTENAAPVERKRLQLGAVRGVQVVKPPCLARCVCYRRPFAGAARWADPIARPENHLPLSQEPF